MNMYHQRPPDPLPLTETGRERPEMKTIGVAAMGGEPREIVERIVGLERIGIKAAWLTAGGGDTMTVFSAAAARTERILMGTSIVPTWPRHPIALAQQTLVIASLAPGRFRLGVGPSHKASIEQTYGFDFKKPLTNLREYVHILKALLREGAIDFDGELYHAHAKSATTVKDVPVMASALQPRSYELCGEITDGAISWVCPHSYLINTAMPALKAGAAKMGRPAPPIIDHTPLCVHDDLGEARAAARQMLANYPRMPFYANMLAAAGFPEVLQTHTWSDEMIESVFVCGNERTVAAKLSALFDQGIGEIIAHVVPAGPNAAKSTDRTLDLLAGLAKG